ncbi:MAG: MFS transporter [Pseudomonadaceae bacterium]|nr:MFS transporter [Pseudomonadaceae bacterium]
MTLDHSRVLRLVCLTAFYFSQGIPLGLLTLALPAWLVEQGASAADVAAYVALCTLPWAFKLVAGPFMDRYSWPSMGLRRPWVMLTQALLVLSLFAAVALVGNVPEIGMLGVMGFVINCAAAVQDVAVDGLAIAVLPETERARANAFMAFGQVAGTGIFGGLSGVLLVEFGFQVAALVAASSVMLIWFLAVFVRERRGDRLLPWTAGVDREDVARPGPLTGVFSNLGRSLILPNSVLLLFAGFVAWVAYGIGFVMAPVFAVSKLAFASEDYSRVASVLGVASAVTTILVSGYLDRVGVKRALVWSLAGLAVITSAFVLMKPWWGSLGLVLGFWALYMLAAQVLFVGFIATNMSMTWKAIAATQFAVYMALSNLSQSAGSAFYAQLSEFSHSVVFMVVAVCFLFAAWLFSRVDVAAHQERLGVLRLA